MLLGIKELLNAVDDLKRIKIIQEQKVRNELAKKEEYAGEKEDLDKLDESNSKRNNEIIEMESQIQSLQERKSRFETKLKQFDEVKEILEQKIISEKKLENTDNLETPNIQYKNLQTEIWQFEIQIYEIMFQAKDKEKLLVEKNNRQKDIALYFEHRCDSS